MPVNKPGQPLDPKLKEFMFFVLSKQGQDLLCRQGEYLPLIPEKVIEERKGLEQSTAVQAWESRR